MGSFVAEFVCKALKLVIEADSGQHAEAADLQRDDWFRSEGFHVLRFWNHDVLVQTDAVLEHIRQFVLYLGHVDSEPDAKGAVQP